jgi:hypothetical protein
MNFDDAEVSALYKKISKAISGHSVSVAVPALLSVLSSACELMAESGHTSFESAMLSIADKLRLAADCQRRLRPGRVH